MQVIDICLWSNAPISVKPEDDGGGGGGGVYMGEIEIY